MQVIKRDGTKEPVKFDNITERIRKLCNGLNMDYVDPVKIAAQVCHEIRNLVTTEQIDALTIETANTFSSIHPDYSCLAARIAISNLYKKTKGFMETINDMYFYHRGPLVSKELYETVINNRERIEAAIISENDFNNYDYFGFKTLERSYLIKMDGRVIERPQYMLMRVALGIHGNDLDRALETYELMSNKYFVHATPTLFNAGTTRPQMASCYLLDIEDSLDGIMDTAKSTSNCSKYSGGIGFSISKLRAKGSHINGTNGESSGIIPFLKIFEQISRAFNQGGKRPGSFAAYCAVDHADIEAFLELRLPQGDEELRTRKLYTALWLNDLFMKRLIANEDWSLFCPMEGRPNDHDNDCPQNCQKNHRDKYPMLIDVYGPEYEKWYTYYESRGLAKKTIKARDLFQKLYHSLVETGYPYVLNKDACNMKNNQCNLGTLYSSNLCTEILIKTTRDEIGTCNLANISLARYVQIDPETGERSYDFQKLYEIARVCTRNLNRIIDRSFYPCEESRRSNMRHRPIGIGVNGLHTAFMMMQYSYTSPEARKLNRDIFETIYYGFLTESCLIAQEQGTYSTFAGSPFSEGRFQFDLWGGTEHSGMWDWEALRANVMKHGVANSLGTALMPTASTANFSGFRINDTAFVNGNTECFQPMYSNLYVRQVQAGEFKIVNSLLVNDLIKLGIWNEEMKNKIVANEGIISNIPEIPQDIKKLYRTWGEYKISELLEMDADRAKYIDQSMSANRFYPKPSLNLIYSTYVKAYELGLKTYSYYTQLPPAREAVKFTVTKKENVKEEEIINAAPECAMCE